ncbi:hypothetical protein [Paenibacillus sp. MMO-177]|uniref:hypothetical protein n=1 Tax=Paenibacillus sp. MMO-177 TaxID=3081289 RepID=UPI0030162BFB
MFFQSLLFPNSLNLNCNGGNPGTKANAPLFQNHSSSFVIPTILKFEKAITKEKRIKKKEGAGPCGSSFVLLVSFCGVAGLVGYSIMFFVA